MSSSPKSTPTAEGILQVCSTGPLSTLLTLLAHTPEPPSRSSMAEMAAQHGQVDILQHCLSTGSDISIDRELAKAAVKSGSRDILKMLLDAGMDINIDLGWMGNPYLYAIICRHPEAYIEWLLAQGGDPNSATLGGGGWPGLAIFSLSGPIELIRMMLLHGARVEGSTALQVAAELGRTDLVRVLVEEGGAAVSEVVDLDEYSNTMEIEKGVGTALHQAARGGSVGVAEFLLGKGADVGARDSKGRTAREVAEGAGQGKVAEVLRKWEENRS